MKKKIIEEKNIATINCLCKDIARHVSHLEAEANGTEWSLERYEEIKRLFLNHYMQSEDNFSTIRGEIQNALKNTGGWTNDGDIAISIKNHLACILNYFLMLEEINKKG